MAGSLSKSKSKRSRKKWDGKIGYAGCVEIVEGVGVERNMARMAQERDMRQRSLAVDAEAGNLREVRRASEIEDVDVVENFETVEAAEDENPAVSKACCVVSPSGGWSAGDCTRLVL